MITWNKEDYLTCGWLISETIRKYSEINNEPNRKKIVALRTAENIGSLDSWLLEHERCINILKNRDVIEAVYSGTLLFNII